MMRSMFAGVSALRNHQIRMDVIGNNIANVNTIGFKAARVNFRDLLSQSMRGAGAPAGDRGGTNPQQVGLGVDIAAITNIFTGGNLQTTGVSTDLAIEGSGFFVLGEGDDRFYTRAGLFGIDRDGWLVAPNGIRVMGWTADSQGQVDPAGPLEALRIPQGSTIDPRATTTVEAAGNLDARTIGSLTYSPQTTTVDDNVGETAQLTITVMPTGRFNEWRWEAQVTGGTLVGGPATGTIELDAAGNMVATTGANFQVDPGGAGGPLVTVTVPTAGPPSVLDFQVQNPGGAVDLLGTFTAAEPRTTPIQIYDSLGVAYEVPFQFTRTSNSTWDWVTLRPDGSGATIGNGTLTFDAFGHLVGQTGTVNFTPVNGSGAVAFTPDFTSLTQFGEESTAFISFQDGYGAGSLESFSVDASGVITGSYSNGLTQALGQVALATFSNPAGLVKAGDTMYQASNNSGDAEIGPASTGSRGSIAGGSVEMSNVDLSQEFTDMIVTQRGFQANSRVITTSDEMLQELVNLKR